MGFKSMNYLDTYKKFIESNKIFFVKFYKEYEGEGGYWNERDIQVSGDYNEQVKRGLIVDCPFEDGKFPFDNVDDIKVSENILERIGIYG